MRNMALKKIIFYSVLVNCKTFKTITSKFNDYVLLIINTIKMSQVFLYDYRLQEQTNTTAHGRLSAVS